MPEFYESFEEEEVFIFRKEINSNAYIFTTISKTINSDYHLKVIVSKTINSNARIKELEVSKTINSNAQIMKASSQTITQNASIKKTYTIPYPTEYDVTYTFPDIVTAEIGWDYIGPDVNDLQVKDTDGAWCWTDTGTPSIDTGPPSGIPCVYTETSSPVQSGDVFTMTLTTPVNAGRYDLYVTFDRCTQGNASAHLYFEAWNGGGWDIIDDWAGDAVTTFTSEGPYDFTSYTNADFKIRFRTVVGGTAYMNDMAVDTVRIYGSPVLFSSNSFIKKIDNEETLTSDGYILKAGVVETVNSNAHIKKIANEETISSNYNLKTTVSETINSNSYIKKLAISKTINSNYHIKKSGTEGSINSNYRIKKLAISKTINCNIWIQEVQSKTINSNSYIKKLGIPKTINSDAQITIGTLTKTINSNSSIKKLNNTKTITCDSWIKEIQSETINSNYYLKGRVSETINSDANIKKIAIPKTINSNFYIRRLGYEGSINSDMFLGYSGQTKTINSNAQIQKLAISKTINSNAQIGWPGQTKTINCNLVIRRAFEGSIRSNYHIFAFPTGSVTSGYSVKKLGNSTTITSDYYIKKTYSNTLSSDSWIKRCYGGKALSSIDANMVSLYHMDEPDWSGVPSEVVDSKGSNHGIALALATTTPIGLYNRAGIFSGINTGINLGNDSSFHTNLFSISIWIYPTSASNNYNDIVNSSRYRLTLRSTRKVQWWIFVTGIGWITAESNAAIPLNKWTNLICSYDGSTAKLYVNNILQTITGSGAGTIPWAGNTVYVGQSGGDTNEYVGKMDDLAFWNVAISQTGVSSIWKEYTNMYSDYRIKKLAYSTTINSNAHIKTSYSKTINSNARIKTSYSKTINSNSSIKQTNSATINSDSWIEEVQSGTINSNYHLFASPFKTINSNYNIKKLGYEGSINSDSWIKEIQSATINSNSNIKGIYTKTITSNFYIKKLGTEGSITSDVRIKKLANSVTINSNSFILETNSDTINSNANIKAAYTKTLTSGLHIIRWREGVLNSNARIKTSYSKTINSNYHIKKIDNIKTIISNAHATRVGIIGTIISDYSIKEAITGSIHSNAHIKKIAIAKTINSNAYIAELHVISRAINTDYFILKITTQTITSNAEILLRLSRINSNAYLKGRPTKDINMSMTIRSPDTTKPWVCAARYINKPIIVSANSLSYTEIIAQSYHPRKTISSDAYIT